MPPSRIYLNSRSRGVPFDERAEIRAATGSGRKDEPLLGGDRSLTAAPTATSGAAGVVVTIQEASTKTETEAETAAQRARRLDQALALARATTTEPPTGGSGGGGGGGAAGGASSILGFGSAWSTSLSADSLLSLETVAPPDASHDMDDGNGVRRRRGDRGGDGRERRGNRSKVWP